MKSVTRAILLGITGAALPVGAAGADLAFDCRAPDEKIVLYQQVCEAFSSELARRSPGWQLIADPASPADGRITLTIHKLDRSGIAMSADWDIAGIGKGQSPRHSRSIMDHPAPDDLLIDFAGRFAWSDDLPFTP